MSNSDLPLLDAIQMAMEAEQKAAAFYDNASQKVASPLGQELLEQLAEFERYHYAKLDDLARSLREEGTFIDYEGKELSLSVPAEVKGKEANKMSVLEIITLAIDADLEDASLVIGYIVDGKSVFTQDVAMGTGEYNIVETVDISKVNPLGHELAIELYGLYNHSDVCASICLRRFELAFYK